MNPFDQFDSLPVKKKPYKDDIGVSPMNEQDIYRAIGGNPFDQFEPETSQNIPANEGDRGFFQRVGDRFEKRNQALENASQNSDFMGGNAGLMYNAIGQTLQKGLYDIPTEAMVSAGKAIPQPVKNFASDVYSDFKNTIPGSVVDTAARGASYVMDQASQGYDKFQRNHPTAGLYLDSTLGFGNAALAALPVKGESIPSRAVGAGQKAVKNTEKFYAQNIRKYSPDISPDEIRQIGGQLIDKANKSGAVIKPEAATGFIDDIARKISPKGKWEGAATLKSEVDDIVSNLAELRGQPMSLDDAMGLESRLGKLAYSTKNYSMGKFSPEGKQLIDIKGALSDMIDNAAESGLVAGDESAISAWREGQKYWSASIKARDIDRIIENAQYMDNPATSIRVGMRGIIRDKNKFSKLSDEQKFYVRRAAKTGVITDAYRAGSSLLGPIITGSIGGTAGALVGGLPGAAIGAAASAAPSYFLRTVAKEAATARQTKRAMRAYESMIEGVGPTKKLTMKQIMALPPDQAKLYLKNINK